MKLGILVAYLIVLLGLSLNTFAQTKSRDSLLLVGGNWVAVNSCKITPFGIKIRGSGYDLLSFHTYPWDEIESLILIDKKGRTVINNENIDALQNSNYITLEHRKITNRIKKIWRGKRITTIDGFGNKVSGRYYLLGTDSILVKNTKVALQDIERLKRQFIPTKVIGTILLGYAAGGLVFALGDNDLYLELFMTPFAATGIGLLSVKRGFDVQGIWKIVPIDG